MTSRTVVLALFLVASAGVAAHAKPVELVSRVAYEPLLAKLKASGGSLERVIHVGKAADLDRLESGRRYKFVVDARGQLAIAPLPADAPSNDYVHPILAGGGPVRTAGGIRVDRASGKIERVVFDQDSKAYCPTLDSLTAAARALTALGVPANAVTQEDHPPQCAP
jgi:hypothetical protein